MGHCRLDDAGCPVLYSLLSTRYSLLERFSLRATLASLLTLPTQLRRVHMTSTPHVAFSAVYRAGVDAGPA